MAKTPVTSTGPYCTPERLLVYVDWRIVADSLRDDDGPRPSKANILDTDTPAGALLLDLCKLGSGDLESACCARGLYAPEDFEAMTGNAMMLVEAVTAGLILLRLFSRRQPSTGKIEDLPAVKQAQETLERLRVGERVFPTEEGRAAGEGLKTTPLQSSANPRLSQVASRYFGRRGGSQHGRNSGC